MANEKTSPTFPALPNTVKSLKSERAAKIAITKAEKAYALARANFCTDAMRTARPSGCDLLVSCNAYVAKTYAHLKATAASAKKQGFSGWSDTLEQEAHVVHMYDTGNQA